MTEQNQTQEEQNAEATGAEEQGFKLDGRTKRALDVAIAKKQVSQGSYRAVVEGRIDLATAKELGRDNGPDGPVGRSTKKATAPKKDRPVALCIACGKPTKGGRFHPGADMKMHRIADEHLRGERDLTDAQREYLESSGKMEQAKKRAEKKATKK